MFQRKERASAPYTAAIMVAAGSAQRMGGIDKQGYPLGDIPVVVRSIRQFQECAAIHEIVVVCREADIATYYGLMQDYGFAKVRRIVAGGSQRQDSVFAGVAACGEAAAYYAIHDGARPLVTPAVIEACLQDAVRHGAAAAGVPVKDTVKLASDEGFVQQTVDRSRLFAIQTPQIFEAGLYRRAMEQAVAQGQFYTDDCQLVEQMGHPVFISRGDYANLKITTPEDLIIAEALIDYYEGEPC